MSKRIQVILDGDTYDELQKEAETRAGLSIGSVARWVLGGWASGKRKKREQEQKDREDGAVYGP